MGPPTRTPSPPPVDLSDLSPRLLAAYERQGITAEAIAVFRRDASPEALAEMHAYEASLSRLGMTLEDVEDPAPLTAAEREAFLRDAATWASPAELESLRRSVDAA